MTAAKLSRKTIAFLATDGFEESELCEPWKAVENAGGSPVLVSLTRDEIKADEENPEPWDVDETLSSCAADDFDGLVLPGGLKNPDTLRTEEEALAFVRDFFEQGKPVAAICHAPQILISAKVVAGRKMTSFPSIRIDLENAGVEWRDESVVCDSGLVTSRTPDDLEDFCAKAIEEFAEGRHEGQAA